MTFIEKQDKLAWIAYFIQQEKTGSPKDFAKKVNIKTTDTLDDYINILRMFTAREDAKIFYDKDRKTYFFSPHGEFNDFKFIKHQ